MLEQLFRPSTWLGRRRELSELLQRSNGKVHIGCNDVRIEGYVNVDVRSTSATDVVHDCQDLSIFGSDSLSRVFSNAFFEHLYVTQRLTLLKDIHRALKAGGLAVFTGLPDFEGVARAYLERRRPGNVSPEFDLDEVYRYTHGAPEGRSSWWLAQLHKGLLDAKTLSRLLGEAGFASPTVFSYCWGNEPNRVTIGFLAQKAPKQGDLTLVELRETLAGLPTNINWESLTFCT